MATPITWQNVQGRSLAEAATPLQYAAQNIGSAFDKLGGVYKDYQTQQQKQVDLAAEANVQGFLDRLQRVQSPEEVAALQASGELDALRAGLRPQDLAKVRGAEEARVGSLMQQTTARNTFNDTEAKRAAEPILEQFRLAGLNGDEGTQARLLAENPNIRGWATAVEQDKVLERKAIEQARADRLAPYNEANTIAESKLKGVQLKSAERANVEADEERRFNERLTTAIDTHFSNQVKAGDTPISDTVAADSFLASVGSEFSPTLLRKQREVARSAFSSNGLASPVGNDAAAVALKKAEAKAAFTEKSANNWSAPGTPNIIKEFNQLAEEVPKLIDKTTGVDAEEDVADIQTLLYDLSNKGIEVEKGVFVTPSINDVKTAIRTAEGGWFSDNKRASNIKATLYKNMRTPEVSKRLAEAKDLQDYARKQAIQELLNAK